MLVVSPQGCGKVCLGLFFLKKMPVSKPIAQRIEAVREHFELLDNWPTQPFALNAWSQIVDPAEFVDGHLTFLLSVQSDALALPYLMRLEQLLLPPPEPEPQPESPDSPLDDESPDEPLQECGHGGKGRQLCFFEN